MVLEVTPGPKRRSRRTRVSRRPRPATNWPRDTARRRCRPPVAVAEDDDRRQLPAGAAPPKFELPPIQRRKLANGMQVLVVENHELPSLSLNVVFPVGTSSDPADKPGLVDLMAAVWDEGTQTRSSEQIAEALANIGASCRSRPTGTRRARGCSR